LCSPVSGSGEGTRKQEFLGAGLKGTTEGESLLHCTTFVVFFAFVYLLTEMEEQSTKHERLRAVCGGHQGVTTKLIKEADELLTVSPLTVEGRSRLDVINKQLRLKAELLSGYDTEIVSLCEVSDIEGDVEETCS